MSETTPFSQAVIDAAPAEAQTREFPNFHHVDEFGKPLQLSEAAMTTSEQSVLGFQHGLGEALQDLPNRTENLNTDRINSFLEERGIEPGEYHVIYEDELPRLGELYKTTLDDNGLGSLFDPRDFDADENSKKGWHDSLSGQTFIVRRRIPELENGPEFTESIIVHELFHAASDHKDVVIAHDDAGKVIKASAARVGLLLPDKEIPFESGRKAPNIFLEEAAASYFEGQYKKEFKSSKLMRAKDPTRKVGVPYEYAKFEGGKVVLQNGYGTAGFALDLMIDAKPELLDAVVESRKSAQGLRDVARIINDIKPGLYSSLSRIAPTLNYEENLEIIRGAIEDREDGGHEMLRTENNPDGHVEDGFIRHGERITYRAANSTTTIRKRLGGLARKSF